MSRYPYNTLDIRPLSSNELKYVLSMYRKLQWPTSAMTLEEVSTSVIFLGAVPASKEDFHLFEKEENVSAPYVLGTLALFPQGNRWTIGYVAVDPAHHRSGIAIMLLKRAIAMCEADSIATHLSLSATDMGAPVYEKVGFVRHAQRQRFLKMPADKLVQALSSSSSSSSSLGAETTQGNETFESFQIDSDSDRWSRGVKLAGLASDRDLFQTMNGWIAPKDSKRAILVSDEGGELIGFAAMRATNTNEWHIGPVVASTSAIARAIFRKLVIRFAHDSPHAVTSDNFFTICPKVNGKDDAGWTDWLQKFDHTVLFNCPMMTYDVRQVDKPIETSSTTKVIEWAYVDGGSV